MKLTFKKITRYCASLLSIAILLTACSKSDSPGTDPGTGTGDYTYILLTNEADLATPGFMTAYNEMPSGDLTNIQSRTLQVKNAFGFTQYGKWIFTRTNIAGQPGIAKFTVGADGKIQEAGFLANGEMFHIISDEEGYYLDETRGTMLLQKFNPSTMQRTGEIDLSSLKKDGIELQIVGKHTIASKEGKLYVGITYGTTAGQGFNDDVVDYAELAVIDIATDEIEKTIKYPGIKGLGYGPSANKFWTMGDDGALYIYASGFHNTPAGHSTINNSVIVRIKKGETDFDKDWVLKAEKYQQHGTFGTAVVKNGKIYVQIPTEPLTDNFGNFMEPIWKYYAIDLNTQEKTAITGIPLTRYAHSNEQCITQIDGQIYLWMANATVKENGYYLLDEATNKATKAFNVTDGGLISGFFRLEK